MDRIRFLMDALEINQVQAMITSKLIEDIPDSKLTDFIVYRMNFVEPMKSKELITKEAVFSFRKIMYLNKIKKETFEFKNIEEVKTFCQTYFKNQDLCYGADGYYDYVIIGMDKDGNLINKYAVNNYGNFLKLESDKEQRVYKWLFENPKRIGDIKIVPYYETPTSLQIEQKEDLNKIDTRVSKKLSLLANAKRVG